MREHGVERRDFTFYGSRRGYRETMMRRTGANVRLRNPLTPGTAGGATNGDGEQTTIQDAAMRASSRSASWPRGPPSKFHGERDILFGRGPSDAAPDRSADGVNRPVTRMVLGDA